MTLDMENNNNNISVNKRRNINKIYMEDKYAMKLVKYMFVN